MSATSLPAGDAMHRDRGRQRRAKKPFAAGVRRMNHRLDGRAASGCRQARSHAPRRRADWSNAPAWQFAMAARLGSCDRPHRDPGAATCADQRRLRKIPDRLGRGTVADGNAAAMRDRADRSSGNAARREARDGLLRHARVLPTAGNQNSERSAASAPARLQPVSGSHGRSISMATPEHSASIDSGADDAALADILGGARQPGFGDQRQQLDIAAQPLMRRVGRGFPVRERLAVAAAQIDRGDQAIAGLGIEAGQAACWRGRGSPPTTGRDRSGYWCGRRPPARQRPWLRPSARPAPVRRWPRHRPRSR